VPVAICPHCGTELDVDFADCGQTVECPKCRAAFTPPLPVVRPVKRPRRLRSPSVLNDDTPPRVLIRHAKFECRDSANGLWWVGLFALSGGIGAVCKGVQAFQDGEAFSWLGLSKEQFPIVCVATGLYTVLVGVFQIYASQQMLQAKHYQLCVVACVMSVIPGVGPCLLGIPAGLIGLMKLRDPWVKKGFAANRPGFDPDDPA
jgi:hypothetical protein